MMTKCKKMRAAIIDLHQKGYTEDFEVRDGLLFWVQSQLLVPLKECFSVETYRLQNGVKLQELHGVVWKTMGIKGILIGRSDTSLCEHHKYKPELTALL